ncbi:S-layer homology domain-containing protein [Sporosarcina sp. Sa2YVA2]|uniref:S-layer homology domain-containing protein n=1 Tax=Sporosarcina quadrami TaxID=2762234 RepID=A0ABR8U6X6_9BACL|nr:S-layer homology domain-containing protein [Sporosarcina quadrami]MBD7983777.1 S-layer homology domain-containing protein [Sporosarcina quadrami]
MKKNKLFLASLTALIAIPSVIYAIPTDDTGAVKANKSTSHEKIFIDVSSENPYFETINEMYNLGFISGYPDGTFKPAENISRKHVAVLLARVLPLEPVRQTKEFKDVPKTNLHHDSIQKVQRSGIMDGDENGNFNPDASLTRVQMAKVIDLAFDLAVKSNKDFIDVPPTHWGNEHVRALYSNGVTTGYEGYFKPNEKVTRAHYAVFIHRALNLGNENQAAPVDPPLAEKIPGQLDYYSEAELRYQIPMAITMYTMARQKVTMDNPNVVSDNEIRLRIDNDKAGQISKENLLYLKRFVERDSYFDEILDKWLEGDFSDIVQDYILLLGLESADNVAGDLELFVHERTKKAEEYYIKEIFGEEALKRHKEQYE